jgi:hypothetical protein
MKYAILGVMYCLLSFCAAFSDTPHRDKIPLKNLPLATGNEKVSISPHRATPPAPRNPLSTDDYVGEIDTVGTTWSPLQHNGSCGRMIRVDGLSNIHAVWTNALDAGLVSRHIYYNMLDSTGWVWDSVGTAVESSNRGGYVTLGMNADGYPFPCFHVLTAGDDSHSAVAADLFPGTGSFQFWELPYVWNPNVLELIWPTIAVDIQGLLHVVSTENPASGIPATPMRMYYCQGIYDPGNFEFEFQQSQTLIGWTETFAADIAASRYSDRVAIVYAGMRENLSGGFNQYNNDIYLVVSEDGITWDFDHPVNVTNFIYPDPSLLPDTLAAMKDTLRAYTDASVFFDHNDDIHVAFTTPYYDEIRNLTSRNNSLIWHWSEETGYYSLVSDGWFGDVPYECGACNRFVQRPCICEDENSGDLFITYQLYDSSDISASGYPQAEIMVSRSTTGGIYWSTGIDVTNTHAPGGESGYCLSEYSITCNETVEAEQIHVLHLIDTGGGYEEGSLDYVIYQKVPIDEIPSTPLMPVRPMHVDSTGMPPVEVIDQPNADVIPGEFRLYQNYPNPFNAATNIRFQVANTGRFQIAVYNLLGQEVTTILDKVMSPGSHVIQFNASMLSSGVYFYQLTAADFKAAKKMILIK